MPILHANPESCESALRQTELSSELTWQQESGNGRFICQSFDCTKLELTLETRIEVAGQRMSKMVHNLDQLAGCILT